jgi:hypothetical protein
MTMASTYRASTKTGTIEIVVSAAVAGEAGIGPQLGWDRDPATPLTAVWAGVLAKMTWEERERDASRRRKEKSVTDVERPGCPRIEDIARPKPPDTTPARKPTEADDRISDRRRAAFWLGIVSDGLDRRLPPWPGAGGSPGRKAPGGGE